MSTAVDSGPRLRIRVTGLVQGVGFRPYVYGLARSLGLGGFARNDERGVLIEVEGPEAAVERFRERLAAEAPALARVEHVAAEPIPGRGQDSFTIEPSREAGAAETTIGADVATCDECLAELFDPADRRYRYPFTNCTNCGPRFTIVTGVPYDRARTTMARFELCDACRREYEDPADRRFHAQANACPDCGPRLRLIDGAGRAAPGAEPDPVAATAAALREGRIVAVKGLGGYHLACRADDERAVAELRRRKHREERPFAVMCRDRGAAERLIDPGAQGSALLESAERPIVIAPRRRDAPVAEAVAPGSPDLGVMLPYTPLHHLLCAEAGVDLVMTSGNVSDEPIAFDDADALTRLGPIADLLCVHDRPIRTRTDDSVLRAGGDGPGAGRLLARRSRGYVPGALPLPAVAPEPVLACGAELKSTFCVVRGGRAFVSHHIGDLKNYETLVSFRDGISHFERLLDVEPRIVVHDLHPDYLSSGYAAARGAQRLIGVQHHHAHLAAVLAERGETGEAVGAIFDGAGLGPDGTVWGGELLVGGLGGYERAGFVFPVRLPGGDAATRRPWRMACAWLAAAEGGEAPPRPPGPLAAVVEPGEWEAVAAMCRSGLASPLTTSAGRLFDAVSALCGIRAVAAYEGQAAIELEAAAIGAGRPRPGSAYPMPLIHESPGPLLIDARPTVAAIAADVAAGAEPGPVAARFHAALAAATAEALARISEARGLGRAVLSGGVFQNRLLLEGVASDLRARGLGVLVPRELPPNDGAISFGQAAVAVTALTGGEDRG